MKAACTPPPVKYGHYWSHPAITPTVTLKKVQGIVQDAVTENQFNAIIGKALQSNDKLFAIAFHGSSNAEDLVKQANECPDRTFVLRKSECGEDEAGLYIKSCPDNTTRYSGANKIAMVGTREDHVKVDQVGTMYILAGTRVVLLAVLHTQVEKFEKPDLAQRIAIFVKNLTT